MLASPELSIVVPAYNEQENLGPLLAELCAVLASIGRPWEILIVDDGSTDGTGELLRAAAEREPRIRPVGLVRRLGQSGALAAGFARARGSILLTLDADLQNDPADLPLLLERLQDADIVSGVRTPRRDSLGRRLSSRIANATRRAILHDRVSDIGCSLKAYRREVLEGIPVFTGFHRFLPVLCAFRGARVVEVPVSHRPRTRGTSKYGLSNRLFRSVNDLCGVLWLKSRMIPGSAFKESPRAPRILSGPWSDSSANPPAVPPVSSSRGGPRSGGSASSSPSSSGT